MLNPTLYNGLIGLFWIIFILVWVLAYFFSRNKSGRGKWFSWGTFFVLVLILLFRAAVFHWLAPYDALVEGNDTIHFVGVVVCGLGILYAFFARFILRKNAKTQNGILAAILGSVLASSLAWLLVFAYFYYYWKYK